MSCCTPKARISAGLTESTRLSAPTSASHSTCSFTRQPSALDVRVISAHSRSTMDRVTYPLAANSVTFSFPILLEIQNLGDAWVSFEQVVQANDSRPITRFMLLSTKDLPVAILMRDQLGYLREAGRFPPSSSCASRDSTCLRHSSSSDLLSSWGHTRSQHSMKFESTPATALTTVSTPTTSSWAPKRFSPPATSGSQ